MKQIRSGMASMAKQTTAAVENKIYGVSWGKVESPTLTRTDDAVDMVAAAGVGSGTVTNDFDTAEIYKDITKVTDAYGNIFVRIPKFYIKKTSGVGSMTLQISRYQHSGYYLPKCFWNFTTLEETDYIFVGAYNASLSDDTTKLESKKNKAPLINKNIVQFRDYAEANGAGYYQMDIHVMDMLQVLFYIEFATLDSQSVCRGFVDGRYTSSDLATVTESDVNRIIVANATAAYYEVGQTISIGSSQGGNQIFYGRTITAIEVYDASNKAISFDGAAVTVATGNYLYNTGQISGFSDDIAASSGRPTGTDGKQGFVYRGVENLWGSIWQFIDGVNIIDDQAWVCDTPADYSSNVFASPYSVLSYVDVASNGYVVEMGYDGDHPSVSLPVSIAGGSYNKYYCNYFYRNTGARIAFVGGYWSDGSYAGLSDWGLYHSSSYAGIHIGGRLLKAAL